MRLLFISCLVSTLIGFNFGQYGEPIVSGNGQYSYQCRQTESNVVEIGASNEYEVFAGKPFTYSCEIFVDTRNCEHNPRSPGCEAVEFEWILPKTLTQVESQRGFQNIFQVFNE